MFVHLYVQVNKPMHQCTKATGGQQMSLFRGLTFFP